MFLFLYRLHYTVGCINKLVPHLLIGYQLLVCMRVHVHEHVQVYDFHYYLYCLCFGAVGCATEKLAGLLTFCYSTPKVSILEDLWVKGQGFHTSTREGSQLPF